MLLALGATAIVVAVLLWEVMWPTLSERLERLRASRARVRDWEGLDYDPGRELRAEQRARALLRSCVNDEEWAMYNDLGFIRVWGGEAGDGGPRPGPEAAGDAAIGGAPYAYLVYPHKPIVAFLPQTNRLLSEYCVAFPDQTRPYGSARLPDSDDVLAKWMALTGDERRIIATANMHLPGRQVDPKQVRRDLWRLGQWEQVRMRERRRTVRVP